VQENSNFSDLAGLEITSSRLDIDNSVLQ
jgi:hypothetical protein